MVLLFVPPAVVAAAPSAPAQVWRGSYGGDQDPGARVIQDAGGWARLWRHLDQPAPAVDFKHWVAVVAFAGQCPTGGFRVDFLEPEPQGDDLRIRWQTHAPAPGRFVTEALTTPWAIRLFPRPQGRLRLEPPGR